jgi:hypothetical protein
VLSEAHRGACSQGDQGKHKSESGNPLISLAGFPPIDYYELALIAQSGLFCSTFFPVTSTYCLSTTTLRFLRARAMCYSFTCPQPNVQQVAGTRSFSSSNQAIAFLKVFRGQQSRLMEPECEVAHLPWRKSFLTFFILHLQMAP